MLAGRGQRKQNKIAKPNTNVNTFARARSHAATGSSVRFTISKRILVFDYVTVMCGMYMVWIFVQGAL